MALHRLQELSIGAPDPDSLDSFYQEIGLIGGNRSWGSADRPDQIKLAEAPYRQLRSLRMLCEDEADIAAATARLDDLGVAYELSDGKLIVADPVNKWTYIVQPGAVEDVSEQPQRIMNFPGERNRLGERADVLREETPRVPRRLGHVVVGSTEPQKTAELCKAIGFRVSDLVGGGLATFLRCSDDHHNFLVTPGPVPYLNHYALEHDDFDSVFRGATRYLQEHGQERQVAGPGRHYIGGNIFWYLCDPSGTFFEFFADMDQITDDEAWQIGENWDITDSWSIWGEKQQPEVFFRPLDMDAVIEGWNRAHG